MLHLFNKNLRRLCSRFRWPVRRRSKPKVIIKRFGKSNSRLQDSSNTNGSATIHPNDQKGIPKPENPIRIATFNAALFSMAPAIPPLTLDKSNFEFNENDEVLSPFSPKGSVSEGYSSVRSKSLVDRPKGILKQSPLHSSSMSSSSETESKQQKFAKSKLRVSINLPDNEISLKRSGRLTFDISENETDPSAKTSTSKGISRILKGKGVLRSQNGYNSKEYESQSQSQRGSFKSNKTVLEVLKELDADILALQDVKAEEEKDMKPLSDLAAGLGMHYVFAESWAPEYGNAVLSKWPIKRSKVQKVFDDSDFRNVLKATIDVPQTGEVDFHCTLLDHLDENWRMKQINAIIESNERPHILAGGINSLDETDYSPERWTDIVKYYEEMGKPTPKVEVMKYLKNKQYTDAKDFAGECESVVIIAKGQNVQGTCKYGTRVDYILVSPDSPYKFVPGSYMVLSSKGTSDHHIVKVDVTKAEVSSQQQLIRKQRHSKQKVVKITDSNSSKGVWKIQTLDR
ncbi:DNAse I-like superfamily protein [Artemisia annua]|uniref:DNAse I-like superfamily protein n=1 Tax=Artemisia annua TaxID=35608 RepID=A0A2U1Q9H2_ARTAN|nr:DNAse I-like superfamily protein [Artemisia annua]